MQGQLTEMKSGGEDTKALAKAAEKSAKVAEDALIVTTRPWISVTPHITGDLVYDAKTGIVSIPFEFVLENVGNSPAMGADVVAKITPLPTDHREVYSSIGGCKPRKDSKGKDDPGFTVFPKQTERPTQFFQITRQEIADEHLRIGGPFYAHISNVAITPRIVGCAVYRFTFSDEYHFTPFVYELRYIDLDTPSPNNRPPIDMSKGRIPADRIDLRQIYRTGLSPD